MAQISFLNIIAALSVLWVKVQCSLFNDPLAPRLVEDHLVRYIDLPDNATQNITIRLDIPNLAEKTARIKLVLDPAVWGKPVEVQLSMTHAQPLANSSDVDFVTSFVHNVAIVDYLSRSGNLPEILRKNATLMLEDNYRAVLKYRRNDGSFGISGSSVFLTAFTAKGLQMANRYIYINESILDGALKWLAQQQQPDGKFVEVEPAMNEKMRALRLTAYVVTIFASEHVRGSYREVVNKAVDYIANRTEHMDIYELALSSYALSLVNYTKSSYCLEQLNRPKNNYWRGKSSSGEIAGYALMASLNKLVYSNMEDMVQWLKTRPFNSYGDIQHTLNRVTALTALSQHFERFSKYRNKYIVRLRFKSKTEILTVDQTDAKMFELNLPTNTKLVQAAIQGTGFGRLQIAYRYEQKVSAREASFALNVELLNTTTAAVQNLQVCIGRRHQTNRTDGLTLVEVFFPKEFASRNVQDLSPQKRIWKILPRLEGPSMVVYYESLGHAMNCFVVTAKQLETANPDENRQKQMDVIAYDYYNQDRVAWVSYKGFTGQHNNGNDYEYLEAV